MRLPKEFRFVGQEVRVTKVDDRVILEPMEPDEPMPWTAIDQLGDSPFTPEGREQPGAPPDAQCSNLDPSRQCRHGVAQRNF